MLYWRNYVKSGCAIAGFHCSWVGCFVLGLCLFSCHRSVLEPIVFLGENFSRLFGPVFFLIVVFMIVTVSAVFYICLLPHVWADSKGWTSLHLVFGHLVLVNTLFHYYKGECRPAEYGLRLSGCNWLLMLLSFPPCLSFNLQPPSRIPESFLTRRDRCCRRLSLSARNASRQNLQ